jgi:hypothetical protein
MMQIKKLNNRRYRAEIDDIYLFDRQALIEEIDALAQHYRARRTAYNHWEFPTEDSALKFQFIYSLKFQ